MKIRTINKKSVVLIGIYQVSGLFIDEAVAGSSCAAEIFPTLSVFNGNIHIYDCVDAAAYGSSWV